MTNRNAYMRAYMAARRKPTMRKALETIRDELADSGTEKGKRLHALAVEALATTGGRSGD